MQTLKLSNTLTRRWAPRLACNSPVGVNTQTPTYRQLRAIKKETLNLLDTFFSSDAKDPKTVADTFVVPLLDAILGDYQSSPPITREAEVLSLIATVVEKLQVRGRPTHRRRCL